MKKKIKIFIADYVPLKNKGEEAIVRGIEELFSKNFDVELAVFDNVDCVKKEGNLTIFPYKLIFPQFDGIWKGWLLLIRKIYFSILFKFNIYGKVNRLKSFNYPELSKYYNESACIIVGHDGFFRPHSCAIISISKVLNKCVGILGAGISYSSYLNFFCSKLYRKAFLQSDFIFTREKNANDLVIRLTGKYNITKLVPDPAFAIKPLSQQMGVNILQQYNEYNNAISKNKIIVGVTVCEKSVVFDASFLDITSKNEKSKFHRKIIAEILDYLIINSNIFVVFLPHSIEEGLGNDIDIAQEIRKKMKHYKETVLLDLDLKVKSLKTIIGSLDFLIGERTHSLINSVSVSTPFIGLTNKSDKRTHDIIGDMCECENLLINMERINIKLMLKKIEKRINSREKIKEALININKVIINPKILEIEENLFGEINEKNQ